MRREKISFTFGRLGVDACSLEHLMAVASSCLVSREHCDPLFSNWEGPWAHWLEAWFRLENMIDCNDCWDTSTSRPQSVTMRYSGIVELAHCYRLRKIGTFGKSWPHKNSVAVCCGFNCCHVACHLNESSTQIVFLQNLGQISPLWNFALEGSRSHVWCRVPWKPCLRDLSQPALSCFGNLGGSRHATLGGIKSYLFFPNSVS